MKGHQPEVIARRRVVRAWAARRTRCWRSAVYAAARPADNERPRAMTMTGKF
jgi:hypothetical protein